MVRQASEWDRHCRRFHALNDVENAVMRQVVKLYGREPETEVFLREIAEQIRAKRLEELHSAPAVTA